MMTITPTFTIITSKCYLLPWEEATFSMHQTTLWQHLLWLGLSILPVWISCLSVLPQLPGQGPPPTPSTPARDPPASRLARCLDQPDRSRFRALFGAHLLRLLNVFVKLLPFLDRPSHHKSVTSWHSWPASTPAGIFSSPLPCSLLRLCCFYFGRFPVVRN